MLVSRFTYVLLVLSFGFCASAQMAANVVRPLSFERINFSIPLVRNVPTGNRLKFTLLAIDHDEMIQQFELAVSRIAKIENKLEILNRRRQHLLDCFRTLGANPPTKDNTAFADHFEINPPALPGLSIFAAIRSQTLSSLNEIWIWDQKLKADLEKINALLKNDRQLIVFRIAEIRKEINDLQISPELVLATPVE